MTAAAVVGLSLGMAVWGWGLKQRRDYCLQQENSHLRSEKFYRTLVKSFGVVHRRRAIGSTEENLSAFVTASGLNAHLVAVGENIYSADALADYHAELKEKYRRVASLPLFAGMI